MLHELLELSAHGADKARQVTRLVQIRDQFVQRRDFFVAVID